jgi:hypothetical protein
MRFAACCIVIDTLSVVWKKQHDPISVFESVLLLSQQTLVFLCSVVCFGACARVFSIQDQGAILRACVVAKFPSLLLIIALAWGYYPTDFYWVIYLYCFTASVSAAMALPGMPSSLAASVLVASAGVAPGLAGLFLLNDTDFLFV